ncbi:lytic transglycosylase domain-containing protein [Aquabacterium sp. OR-4]|uniref:lytic transglycosylase domain-containing protein n=1 Tax=Aquabacterium sp. OR-4 TaxID=2978127 RepID=UPI0028C72C32|nr:lytic transglycosylase domain-containing protein [Aquabacterium sp. OR-4]MDT7837408.1 lytic transglycosylase domain-containing protein [Aquabacterium sp. OR-4]
MTCLPFPRPRLRAPLALRRAMLPALAAALALALPAAAQTTPDPTDATVLEARDAARKGERKADRSRLAAARAVLSAANHPLLSWVEYWDLGSRLGEATVDEVEAFYARWPGSYVEDRLRNDWLLELGRRRDFANLARDFPRFRMNDDREVTCWWLLTEHLAGRDVRDAARSAWFAQREADDGCNMLATAMVDAKRFSEHDVWLKARYAVEGQRPGAARAAVGLLGNAQAREVAEALDNPARFLRRSASPRRLPQELRLLALMRLAATDHEAAAQLLGDEGLTPAQAAWGWSYTARQAAFKLAPEAVDHAQRAVNLLDRQVKGEAARQPGWTDETLGWNVRAALRSRQDARWPLMLRLIDSMSPAGQKDPAWQYWRARALAATAREGAEGEAQRAESQRLLDGLSPDPHFYGQLSAEALGRPAALPPRPAAITPAEREAARSHPGLQRALLLVNLGLRDEARREWNFSLRGMDDRALNAAARLACDAADWQLCINTAERTRSEVDIALRYPTPWAEQIRSAAAATGLDAPYVFGLIRQETRFMPQLKSHVGASGLMQVMPATARWVAKKIGMDWSRPELITEPLTNLKLGTSYLKLVLDDLGGSQAMAAAAYNAGPGRPRRWREGGTLDAAAWTESIPFNETRDYVKRVTSAAAVYDSLQGGKPPALRSRLGQTIGPRESGANPANTELP